MIKLQNCAVQTFLHRALDRQIICFCAGQKFYEFCERFHLENKILYVIDNFKAGQTVRIGSSDIPVLPMSQLDMGCRKAVCVLTSMGAADEIVRQLDSLPVCNGAEVYAYELLTESEEKINLRRNQPQKIPKKIHYCWFGGGKLPVYFQKNIESWHTHCPEYEIIEWNESNYDVTKNKYMKQAYEHKKWGFVPDYARLDIVNTYGGIYLDTDVQMLKSFDILLQYDFFCGFENAGSVNFGQGFGAVGSHPIISDMLNEYDKMEFCNEDGNLNLTPSPVYQTSALERWGLQKNGMVQQAEHFLVLSSEFFSPINEFGYGVPTENTFSIHQYAAAWYDEEQRNRKEKIIRNYEMIQKRIGE
ncbi:MAG: hypothetical protein K2N34_06950 [Lachnospiraceae bacterium]|nr:hypothetical protein [Lachnospiraceae bacterium]